MEDSEGRGGPCGVVFSGTRAMVPGMDTAQAIGQRGLLIPAAERPSCWRSLLLGAPPIQG